MHRQVLHKLVIKDLPTDRCRGKQRVRSYLAAREALQRSSGWWMLSTYLYVFWKLIYEQVCFVVRTEWANYYVHPLFF